jgi:uncharacterized protein
MGIEHDSVVDHPLTEVFAWHTRPGAMRRLVPPWQPMKVLAEAESLADGRAVLGLPGGMRWVAQHDPAAFDPPHRFVDALSSQGLPSWPALVIGKWRHTHEFSEVAVGTRVYDHVDTPVPAAALRSTFVYRHRQLADDLAAHRDAADAGIKPLVVAVTGASGLVGSALTAFLSTGGHRVIRLVRRPASREGERQWEPEQPAPDLLSGVDAVVHLAGSSIASRVGPTRRLAEAAACADDGPRTLVSASAIGIYGTDRGDALLCEDSARGEGLLADAVADWEAATAPAAQAGLRVVTVRTGIVQSARGGTLRSLRPLFAAGLGSGRQWLSWIGLDDLLDVYYRALYDIRLTGPVNAVAPEPVRNADYTKALAGVLHRPALLPRRRHLAKANQRVVPAKLETLGHRFRRAKIDDALAHELGHG